MAQTPFTGKSLPIVFLQFPHHFHLQAYTNQFCLGGDKTVTGFHQLKDGNEPFLPFTFRLFQYESFCVKLLQCLLMFTKSGMQGKKCLLYIGI